MNVLQRVLILAWGGTFLLFPDLNAVTEERSTYQTQRMYLSGKGPSVAIPWEFFSTTGQNSGEWTTIPVPSNWEQEGFGGLNYGHDDPDGKHAEVGIYRTRFRVPEAWKEMLVRLVIEASMTETSVKVNGQPVGALQQGGYQKIQINLNPEKNDSLLYGAENELEITVAKKPSNRSLDISERKADYWVFGGIYRPVYLEISPRTLIHRVAIDARADGHFEMDVFPQVHRPKLRDPSAQNRVDAIRATLETLDGQPIAPAMSSPLSGHGAARVTLETQVDTPRLWSPEFPNLYQVRTQLLMEGEILHEVVNRFGFRTFELRPGDGLYLNNRKLKIRGINRNGFRPDTARALDPEDAWEDARAIKAMNANLVRAHLPPTKAFLEACDQLGLLFILELTNWQAPATDPLIARNIAYALVTDYQNYPSVVFWANGNEGGFSREVDDLFALIDKQGRPVLHPWALFDRINTYHYPSYDQLATLLQQEEVVLPTEALHGLYDGGHGAGLEDFWTLSLESEQSAGLVLWCWADAAIQRLDRGGELDTDGDHSADGIVGPYGKKEGSYYTVREIWSPVQVASEFSLQNFDGSVPVENRFLETDLNQCSFHWKLIQVSAPVGGPASTAVLSQGSAEAGSIPPGSSGEVTLPLPADWDQAHALEWIASDPHGRELMNWVWKIQEAPKPKLTSLNQPRLSSSHHFTVHQGSRVWSFSPKNGRLLAVSDNGKRLGLGNGPVRLAADSTGQAIPSPSEWHVEARERPNAVTIQARSITDRSSFIWTVREDGGVTLEYDFQTGEELYSHLAIGFDLPKESVISKSWLGDGPFRIWNNRRKGPRYGLWENTYNNGLSGYMGHWQIPEFKGVFGNVDWMKLELKSRLSLLLETETIRDIGVLRPFHPTFKRASWSYPDSGGLFVFHVVPSVGTKFKPAEELGPQSMPQSVSSMNGVLHFHLFPENKRGASGHGVALK